MMRARTAMVAGVVLLGLLVTGCSGPALRVDERFSFTHPWEGIARVEIETDNGQVELRVADVPSIEVNGTKYVRVWNLDEAPAALAQLEVKAGPDPRRPDVYVIEFDTPAALRGQSAGVALEVLVPGGCPARVKTDNGRIQIVGLRDEIELTTGNGRIEARELRGTLDADTSNGRISVRQVVGDCRLRTSNGRIDALDVHGSLRARTSNGRVEVEVTPPADGEVVVRTGNGSVHLTLPPALGVDLRLDTGNGRVVVDADALEVGESRKLQLRSAAFDEFEATLNGGGCPVEVSSGNGSVHVRFR